MVVLAYHVVDKLSSLGTEDVTFKSHLFLIAITFAWFGDMFLMGTQDIHFMLGLGSFLIMQICYIISFRSFSSVTITMERLAMLVLTTGLNFLIKDKVKYLQVPVIVYSVVLSITAITASEYAKGIEYQSTALSTTTDVTMSALRNQIPFLSYGTKLFVISDALIALSKFGVFVHNSTFQTAIMVTYILGQLLIANGYVATLKIHAALKKK
jgi:uncharacterized membrane protein YhhN